MWKISEKERSPVGLKRMAFGVDIRSVISDYAILLQTVAD